MASFIVPKTRQVIQIHPRVLKQDHNCCDCSYLDHTKQDKPFYPYCTLHEKEVQQYDECSAFEPKKVEL